MSQENVELAVRALDTVNRGDLDAFLALMDDDVEVVTRIAVIEGGLHGHDGVRFWWENMFTAFPDFDIEVVDVRDLGDVTLASLRALGHGAGSNVPFEDVLWQAGRWRRGKCVWWRAFETEADALDAVGLSEAVSQENTEIVREFIEAAHSGDMDAIEAFVAVSDPSIEHTRLPAASGPETYGGHDGVRRWFTDMADLWREWRNEIEELVEVGPETVAARVRFIAVGRESGVPVEAQLGLVCVLSEGKILRSRTYASGEAALEAVGPSE